MVKLTLDLNLKYLLAVSGGPDSMAMVDIFLKQGYKFEIAHVNYHHREASDFEEEMIKEFGKANNIKVHVLDAYYRNIGNFEDWARVVRYEFFNKIVKENKLNKCIVAHHLDDVIETYYMQLKRGYVSYYGLKEETIIKNTPIVRPLLKVTKGELEDYVKMNHIPYSIDITNSDKTLLRNKIRIEVINNLSKEDKLKILKEIDEKNILLKEVDKKVEELLKHDAIKITILNQLEKEVKERFIFTWVKTVTSIRMSKRRINDLVNKISCSEGNTWVQIKDNYYFIKEYDSLRIVERSMFYYCLMVDRPSIIDHALFYFNLSANPKKFYIKDSDYPLTIEIAKSNDTVKVGSVKKTMNRFFIDNKIPAYMRLYWPKIVNNKGEIVFVPKNCKDEDGLYVVKSQ